MKPCCTAVMLVLLVGCGTASRVVRLDTGQTDTLVFTPRSGAEPVALANGEFQEAVSALARDVRPPARPQEAARRLFEVEARSGSYTYETSSHRLTPHEPGKHLAGGRINGGGGGADTRLPALMRAHRQARGLSPPADGKPHRQRGWTFRLGPGPGQGRRQNTENIVPLDKGIHTRISSLYSSIQRDITGSSTLTVRKWLSTQSYEAQREFGLIAIEKVTKGFW